MPRYYFEGLPLGTTVELGSQQVHEADMIAFAQQFDPQPFHVDPERAKASLYGGLIASGWYTVGIYMRLLAEGLLNDATSMGSPGVDELRWPRPVRPGDTLRARFTVIASTLSRSRPTMGIVRSRGEVFNQHGELVMSIIGVGFFGRRPSGPA
jgi:acyl dehydratase